MTTPSTATDKRKAFRRLLEGDACIRPATAFDPLSALAARELGYPAGILAGSIASLSVLGAPDIALLTLGELAEQAGVSAGLAICHCWWMATMATATRSMCGAAWWTWRPPASPR